MLLCVLLTCSAVQVILPPESTPDGPPLQLFAAVPFARPLATTMEAGQWTDPFHSGYDVQLIIKNSSGSPVKACMGPMRGYDITTAEQVTTHEFLDTHHRCYRFKLRPGEALVRSMHVFDSHVDPGSSLISFKMQICSTPRLSKRQTLWILRTPFMPITAIEE